MSEPPRHVLVGNPYELWKQAREAQKWGARGVSVCERCRTPAADLRTYRCCTHNPRLEHDAVYCGACASLYLRAGTAVAKEER